MGNSFISADSHLPLLTILLLIVWFGFYAERHKVLGRVPGIVWILVLATALSNFHIIPFEAPIYGIVFGFALPLAVPLLLMKAQIAKIIRESGRVLVIFMLGAITVCIGGLLASALFDLGPAEPKILATYVAAWIGGMVNMLSLSQLTQLTPTEFSIAVSASAPVSVIGLAILCVLPSIPFVRRHFPSPIMDTAEAEASLELVGDEAAPKFNILHIASALAMSAAICTASGLLIGSGLFPESWRIETYNLFIITMLAILAANLFPRQLGAIEGEFDLGMFLMYIFFAAIGAGTDAVTFITQAPVYFAFGLTIIITHIVLLLGLAKLFHFDLAETIIGSGANIVGAAPAAGIASSQGWRTLVTPAIATGMLGYAVANFFGLMLYEFMR